MLNRTVTRRGALPRLAVLAVAVSALATVHGSGASAEPRSADQGGRVLVRVALQGSRGSVISIPRGIDCKPTCAETFRSGSQVVLVAGSARSSRFQRWSGSCVGRSISCVLATDRDQSVSARFVPSTGQEVGGAIQTKYWLYVTASGRGEVKSSPAGIDCPSRCEKSFRKGTAVTLRAEPASGYTADWESLAANCSGLSCQARMDSNANVSVAFVKTRR